MQQHIEIEKLEGNLVSQVKLINVKFPNKPIFDSGNVIFSKEIVANYNLIKAFNMNMDFAAATHLLEINDADVIILRNKKDKWNILDFYPNPVTTFLRPLPLKALWHLTKLH